MSAVVYQLLFLCLAMPSHVQRQTGVSRSGTGVRRAWLDMLLSTVLCRQLHVNRSIKKRGKIILRALLCYLLSCSPTHPPGATTTPVASTSCQVRQTQLWHKPARRAQLTAAWCAWKDLSTTYRWARQVVRHVLCLVAPGFHVKRQTGATPKWHRRVTGVAGHVL